MAEVKGISFTSVIIGIGLGAILVYLYLKNRNPTMTLQNQTIPNNLDSNYSNLIGIGSLQHRIGSLQHRIDLMEQRLDRLQTQPVPIQQSTIAPISQIQTSQNQQYQNQNQAENTYKNNEQWKIQRNEKGRIESINVIRDAKVTNKQ